VSDGQNARDRDTGGAPDASPGGSGAPPGPGNSAPTPPSPAGPAASRGSVAETTVPGQSTASANLGVATTITEISERATLLIHEEIELAKTEVTEKVTALARGAAVGVAAGIFIVTAIFFVLIGCAWVLYYYLPIGTAFTYFIGFFAMALILLILGAIAGLIAARVVRRGAPPTPDMAIAEARRIRETVAPSGDGAGSGSPPATVAPGGDAPSRGVG
jgi:hypothetical protein